MLNNDVLRSLRYTLKASDAQMAEIAALGGCTVDEAEVHQEQQELVIYMY